MTAVRPAVTFDDFEKLDIRVGRIVDVADFPEGKFSTHVLRIDFGTEIGIKKSLAKLRPNYDGAVLVNRMVLCVVNFPPRQIGKHRSEVLTLGVPDENGNVTLIQPDREVPLGGALF